MKLRITHLSPAYWRVTLDNPPLNLIDPEVIDELQLLIGAMEVAPDLKVVVFDSVDPDYFIAHYDLLRAGETSTAYGPTGLPLLPDFAKRMAHLPVISIASVRGRARGVGSEFIMALDMRFGSLEKMILGQPEVGLGLFPGGGGTERLPLLVGRSRALEVITGSQDFDAATAERYGWINRAIPDAELDAFVDELAGRIASFNKAAIGEAKRQINRSSTLPEDAHLVASQNAFTSALSWPETLQRVAWALEQGFQERSDFELNMGPRLFAQ